MSSIIKFSNLYLKLKVQSDLYVAITTRFATFERGWAGQTWTWSSQRGCLTFSPTPIKTRKKRNYSKIFLSVSKTFSGLGDMFHMKAKIISYKSENFS